MSDSVEKSDSSEVQLLCEKLQLEREALAVERERLEAARSHMRAEEAISKSRHPFLVFLCVLLLIVIAFGGGVFTGYSVSETKQQKMREARLAQALSKLGDASAPFGETGNVSGGVSTNQVHRNVSVVVIQ